MLQKLREFGSLSTTLNRVDVIRRQGNDVNSEYDHPSTNEAAWIKGWVQRAQITPATMLRWKNVHQCSGAD